MIVTISGPPGSGKTTVGKLLAERLGYEFVSTGMIFRHMAEEKGMSLAEFGEMALTNHDIDKELDRRMLALAGEKRKLVLEGRLAAHMLHLNGIPAFKVRIDASPETRAERNAGRENKSVEQVREEIIARESCERERYKKVYNIDLNSLAVYDHVEHTDGHTPEEVVNSILLKMEGKLDG